MLFPAKKGQEKGFLLWVPENEWRETKGRKQFNSNIERKHNVSQTKEGQCAPVSAERTRKRLVAQKQRTISRQEKVAFSLGLPSPSPRVCTNVRPDVYWHHNQISRKSCWIRSLAFQGFSFQKKIHVRFKRFEPDEERERFPGSTPINLG